MMGLPWSRNACRDVLLTPSVYKFIDDLKTDPEGGAGRWIDGRTVTYEQQIYQQGIMFHLYAWRDLKHNLIIFVIHLLQNINKGTVVYAGNTRNTNRSPAADVFKCDISSLRYDAICLMRALLIL